MGGVRLAVNQESGLEGRELSKHQLVQVIINPSL